MLKRRGLFSCQVYSVELIDSQFLILQVRQLETENIKMKRKKILLEEYNNSDITKGSFKNKKEDMVFGGCPIPLHKIWKYFSYSLKLFHDFLISSLEKLKILQKYDLGGKYMELENDQTPPYLFLRFLTLPEAENFL